MSTQQVEKYSREGGRPFVRINRGRDSIPLHCYQNPRLANASIDALITDYLYDEDTDDMVT